MKGSKNVKINFNHETNFRMNLRSFCAHVGMWQKCASYFNKSRTVCFHFSVLATVAKGGFHHDEVSNALRQQYQHGR